MTATAEYIGTVGDLAPSAVSIKGSGAEAVVLQKQIPYMVDVAKEGREGGTMCHISMYAAADDSMVSSHFSVSYALNVIREQQMRDEAQRKRAGSEVLG
jgi:hypothetical protein